MSFILVNTLVISIFILSQNANLHFLSCDPLWDVTLYNAATCALSVFVLKRWCTSELSPKTHFPLRDNNAYLISSPTETNEPSKNNLHPHPQLGGKGLLLGNTACNDLEILYNLPMDLRVGYPEKKTGLKTFGEIGEALTDLYAGWTLKKCFLFIFWTLWVICTV